MKIGYDLQEILTILDSREIQDGRREVDLGKFAPIFELP